MQRLVTVGLAIASGFFALYCDTKLPEPLGSDAPLTSFSESRASEFAESLGPLPRLAGSQNERDAFEKLQLKLQQIADDVHLHSKGTIKVDLRRTQHSGTFPLLGPGVGVVKEQTMAYDRLDAVAARVRVIRKSDDKDTNKDSNGTPNSEVPHSLLLASHVDSVHVSPGGCDNAANVAIVVETFRAFTAQLVETNKPYEERSEPSRNNKTIIPLILMFTSAEEDGFMGAAGVVRDHPWFNQVASFVNFEAMGSGGPHRLFRITDGGSSRELVRMWSRGAKSPVGTVIASDIFNSGLIKSDTDFRVFRDIGDVPGLDVAFVEDTKIYHTPFDTFTRLITHRPGSIQASGDNALGFALEYYRGIQSDEGIIEKGDVSTTVTGDIRRGKVGAEDAFQKTSTKTPLTVWFSFPLLKNFVVVDVDGRKVAISLLIVAISVMLKVVPFSLGRDSGKETKVLPLLATIVGVCGVALSFFAAPIVSGLSAVIIANLHNHPTPWVSNYPAFLALTVSPAVLVAFWGLECTRVIIGGTVRRALLEKKKENKNKKTDDSYSSITKIGNRTFLACTATFLALLGSYMFYRGVASAYVFAVPALLQFVAVLSVGPGETEMNTFLFLPSLALSAILAFPTAVSLVNLAVGMTPRSRPPPGTYVYLYDVVCGVVTGGAVAVVSTPLLACVSVWWSLAEKSPKKDKKTPLTSVSVTQVVTLVCLSLHLTGHVLMYVQLVKSNKNNNNTVYAYTETNPQQVASFVVVDVKNENRKANWVVSPVGPGNGTKGVVETLRNGGLLDVPGASYHCEGGFNDSTIPHLDLASYSLNGTGSCVYSNDLLSKEIVGSDVNVNVATVVGARRQGSGEDGWPVLTPITVDFAGHTRFVLAVDNQCVKRLAFVFGQDAAEEDRMSNQSESDEEIGAKPPTGPWRLTSKGRAGAGTFEVRYAVFGVGGADAQGSVNSRKSTLWLESFANPPTKCFIDALRIRVDVDWESETFQKVKDKFPTWQTQFAKHHTPLKLAIVTHVGLESKGLID